MFIGLRYSDAVLFSPETVFITVKFVFPFGAVMFMKYFSLGAYSNTIQPPASVEPFMYWPLPFICTAVLAVFKTETSAFSTAPVSLYAYIFMWVMLIERLTAAVPLRRTVVWFAPIPYPFASPFAVNACCPPRT